MKATLTKYRINLVIETVAIAAVYWALARLGQFVAIAPGNVTPVYPASGFALAVVMTRGYRTWLGLWIGIAFATAWPFLDLSTLGDGLRTIATGIAAGPGAILQAFLGSYLIKVFCANRDPFEQTRNVFLFVGTQAVACLSSATLGVLALCVAQVLPWPQFVYTWITWYLGDGIGVILVAPFLLTSYHLAKTFGPNIRTLETGVILALSVVTTMLVFSKFVEIPLLFVPLPLVLWAAVRGGPFAASATVLAATAVAIYRTSIGLGPFVSDDPNASLLSLQLFTAFTAITGLAVSAALHEHEIAEQNLRTTMNELQQGEARYLELFENANDLVFTVNLDGRFTSINKTAEEVTGFRRDELIGADISLLVPPQYVDKVREMMRHKIATHERTTYEIEILAKSGHYVPIEISSRIIVENGKPVVVQGIARDITERKQSEEELRVAAAAFKTHECIIITDEEGTILRVNERFTEVTGYTAAEAVGRNPRILKSGRHEQEFYGQMWTAIKDEGFWEGEIWNRRKDGEIFPQRLTITAVKNESNQTTHYVAIAQDITERKRAEQQLLVANESLRQSHAELERSNLELQQMTYAASHDLQEPLRSISSFSQLVDRRYRALLDDDGCSWLDAIVRNTKRMQALIQDLRAYTELDSPSHSFEPTDLEKVLAAAIDNLNSSIRDSGAEVTGDQLPVIMGNPSQLVQLFQNLIGNAIKYRSEQTPKVHIAAEQSDETWIISVSDNGIGIEAKHHDAIFEIFRRLHHHHEQPGTGIGLAICRRVVQQHHGEISVESGPSQGSTFRFTIPIELHEVKV